MTGDESKFAFLTRRKGGYVTFGDNSFWFPKLLFSESVCNRNAWDCIWPEQGILCWMFCVVFTKTGLFGLSPDYFLGQA